MLYANDIGLGMNFRQIEAFYRVMNAGSMTGAARDMRISQPNVSRMISQLEKSVRMKLFDRSGGRLVPTEEGAAFFREVERNFVSLRRLEQAARNILFFGGGTLRIAAYPALSWGFLPRVIRRFRERNPQTTITFQVRSSATVVQWASEQQCDLGIAANVKDAPGVEIEPFLNVQGVCALPAGHRLSSKSVIHPKDLENEVFISLALEDDARAQVDQAFEQAGVRRILAVETQYAATICMMVAEGVGVSIVNPIAALDFVDRGVVLRRFSHPMAFNSSILLPSSRAQRRLRNAFVEEMRKALDDEHVRVELTLRQSRSS